MSPAELDAALESLEMEQVELARIADVNPKTVRRWVSGEVPVPGLAALLLRLLLARPELKGVIGVRRRTGRGRPPAKGARRLRSKPRTLAA
jgi:hypothetical protein